MAYMSAYIFSSRVTPAGTFGPVDGYLVVGKCARGFCHLRGPIYRDQIKELMGRGIAQGGVMFENDQFSGVHFPPRRRMVMIEHVDQGVPEEFQVIFRKTRLVGKMGGDISFRPVEGIGDDVLASHRPVVAALLFCFLFRRHGHPGDADLHRDDGVDAAGEIQLDGTADLAAVYTSGHDGTKGPYIKEILTHPLASLFDLIAGSLAFFLIPLVFDANGLDEPAHASG